MLVFGDDADIDAKIEVGTLIVRGGELRGEVKATELVELHAPARVLCDIHSPQLFVDKGVHFEGRCTMPDAEVHEIDEAPEEVMEAEPESESDSESETETESESESETDSESPRSPSD